MPQVPDLSRLADETALKALVSSYARCCDLQDSKGFAALYTADGILEGEGFRSDSQDMMESIPRALDRFVKTYHTLLNTMFDVQGDQATGVIYSMAHHLTPLSGGKYNDLVMYITYHDRYIRTGEAWKFQHRRVAMEFTENRTVENLDTMPTL